MNMFKEWLTQHELRGTWNFIVIEFNEKIEWKKSKIKSKLKSVIEKNTVEEGFLDSVSSIVKWDLKKIYKIFVTDAQPKSDTLRKGKFGEVLHGEILEEFYNYEIPLKKFQYQITSGTSMHGTDMILFSRNESGIELLLFVETRLRTVKCYDALTGAYQEILSAQNEKVPSYLKFILKELKKTDPKLFDDFLQYGIEITPKDKFRIGGIFEKDEWLNEYLENVKKIDNGSMQNLTIDVIKIKFLNELVNQTYKEVGIPIE